MKHVIGALFISITNINKLTLLSEQIIDKVNFCKIIDNT